jgi:hypothetical protein
MRARPGAYSGQPISSYGTEHYDPMNNALRVEFEWQFRANHPTSAISKLHDYPRPKGEVVSVHLCSAHYEVDYF